MNHSQLLKELAQNASLLLTIVLVFDLMSSGKRAGGSLLWRFIAGILFGLIAILLMVWTVVVPPGYFFDTRTVLLSISGLFFGLVPTVVAAVFAVLYRLHLGGLGVAAGVLITLWAAGAGIFWHLRRKDVLERIGWHELVLFGLVVHAVPAVGLLLQPLDLSAYSVLGAILPASAIYVVGSALLGALLVHRIKREKRALEVQVSEERHRILFEQATDAMMILSGREGCIVETNGAANRLLRSTHKEHLLGRAVSVLLEAEAARPSQTANEAHAMLDEALKTGSWSGERILQRLDGSRFHSEMILTRFELRGEVSVHALIRDLSERKQQEEAVRRSEEMHRTLIETSMDGVWWVGPDGRILGVNDTYCRMSGYSRDQLLTMRVADLECIESDEMVRHHVRLMSQMQRQRFVSKHRRRDGSEYPVEISLQYLPIDSGMIVGFLRDITERKRLEEALERRIVALTRPLETDQLVSFEELFDLEMIQRIQDEFAAATGVSSIITRPDGTQITRPSRFCRLCASIIRKTDAGLRNCSCFGATVGRPNRHGPVVQSCFEGGLLDAGASITIGGHHIANWLIGQIRTGKESDESVRAYAREIGADEDAAVEAFRDVPVMSLEQFQHVAQVLHTLANQLSTQAYQNIQQARFISDRRKVEQALIHSEHELRLVWEEAQDGMRLTDGHGKVRRVNEAYCRLMDKGRSELENQPFTIAYSEQDRDAMMSSFLKKCSLGIIAPRLETRVILWNGKVLDLELSNSRLSLPGEPDLVLSLVRDITERRKSESERQQLQAQLIQARKMEAVGRLAGGVAHDFNNLLAAMMLHLGLLDQKPGLDAEVQQAIAELREEAQRAANLTRQLLMFSRRAVLQMRVADLNAVVENLLKMLRRLIGEQVTLVFRKEEPLPPVNVDIGMIEQVILNLTVNARDAMSEGGTVVIRTATREVAAADLSVNSGKRRIGSFVVLSVSDTGCGIAPELLSAIFEPFFSTKGQGQGTGLGLCTVDGIVTQHKGWIEVESEVGKGSSFHVYIPLAPKSETCAVAVATSGETIHSGTGGGREKILLVEDENSVRTIARRSLERKGYRVTEACTALEALDRWQEASGDFDLLLTDMVMPEGLNGLALAKQLLEQKPSLKVIIASGYSEDLARMGEMGAIRMEFLPKPFDIATLNGTVRRCLDSKSPSITH